MTIDELKSKYARAAAAAPGVGDADKAQRLNMAKSLKATIPAVTRSMNEFVTKLENGRVSAKTAQKLIAKLSDIGRTMDSFK